MHGSYVRVAVLGCVLSLTFAFSQEPKTLSSSAAPDTKVFGLQIGAELTLPECERIKIGSAFTYSESQQRWCYERIDRNGMLSLNEAILIKFPLNEWPRIVNGLSLVGQLIDGRLEGVGFNTFGLKAAPDVLQKLTEKYGSPSDSERYEVQNRLGAKFTTVRAIWNFSNLVVVFRGLSDSLDTGLVNIDTPRCKAAREQKLKELTNSGPPL
jgi:hypothetical protein